MTTTNALARETSPYLLQHRDNPVHWQPWGPDALERARREDKPILLSVGYAACHWCHVMAQESFENPDIAALMNERFVSVKVDREERPDLDAIYQHALMLMGEQGGWPLTMFLTPTGEPFFGGTYYPPTSRWGRPGFPEVLRAVADAYAQQRPKLMEHAGVLRAELGKLGTPAAGEAIASDLPLKLAEAVLRAVDGANGGIGMAPKFPQTPLLDLIWRGWKRGKIPALRDAVLLTLDHITQGGIYDHVGGGFARYSTDARWLVPHFEKMLYDNALLIGLLTEAWRETRNPLYAARVAETVAWLEREMRLPEGGFASSLDADSEHEEGKFYVWTEAEIDGALGARAARFKATYDVTPAGNWEGRAILNRLSRIAWLGDEEERAFAHDLTALLAARAHRIRPGLDDKALADWNGLMIAALAEAAAAFARPDWLTLATQGFAFVVVALGDGDRLKHSFRAGRAAHAGMLDDYAQMIRAALTLHEITGEDAYLDRARRWLNVTDAHFWDVAGGGYFYTADDGETLIVRTKPAYDGPIPAANGVMAQNLARLFYLTGEARYRERAETLFAAFAGEVARSPAAHAALLAARDWLDHGLQIVVAGAHGTADAGALIAAVFAASLPNRVLTVVPPRRELPAGHPARGKGPVEGRAAAYICEGPTCSLPITTPDALTRALTTA
ncbi:MAG: thioredoxin domain-containing protein [Alphaproteobacteria bacterium]|nr:thioredoxin domain-containing protein [Alphaproteobacteria bacterium]